jgi:hypothetical protein
MAKNDVEIKVNTGSVQGDGLSKVTETLKGIPVLGRLASVSLGALATVAAGLASAFAGAAAAVKEFAAAEERVATLDAALAQHGLLAEETRERYQALAGEMQALTGIADDQWLDVLTKLTQFGSKPETIGMDVEAVKNLAGIVGNLGTATDLYAKALAGNFSLFGRYGIYVAENADKTKRLADLQEQLAVKGGGQLEARAQSLGGRFRQLTNYMGDTVEAIGQNIARATRLGEVIQFVTGTFEWWSEKLGGTVEKLEGIKNVTQSAAESTGDYATHLAMVAQLTEKVAKATDAEVAAIKAKQQAIDEVSDAQLALDIANVDEAVRTGKMTPRAGVQSRTRLRTAAARSRFEREQSADLAIIQANERGLGDLLQTRQSLSSRRDALRSSVADGSRAESREGYAKGITADLMAELRELLDAEQRSRRVDQLDPTFRPQDQSRQSRQERMSAIRRGIINAARIGPEAAAVGRQELAEVEGTLGTIDSEIATRRESVLTTNTDAARRMATREAVFGLNSQRDQVVGRGELATASQQDANAALAAIQQGTGRTSAALQSSLQSVIGASQASQAVAEQLARVSQDQERRLRQLEQQIKNSANR